jgi:transcriptional regulator with XRE-family HTH domain
MRGVAGKQTELGPIGVNVTHTVRRFREERRLGYAELSRKLAKMGREIPPLGLRRIESGERRVDVDDLVALALALEVSPLALLLPIETSSVTSQGDQYPAHEIWEWAEGRQTLPPDPLPTDRAYGLRHLRFLSDSNPLIDWSQVMGDIAGEMEEMRRRGHDQ